MLKRCILLSLFLVGLTAFAQEQNEPAQPYQAYCEIVTYYVAPFMSGAQVREAVHFAEASFTERSDQILVDETGRSIHTARPLYALEYMSRRGWKLQLEYHEPIVTNTDRIIHHWVLTKTVTNQEQVLEGLIIRSKTR